MIICNHSTSLSPFPSTSIYSWLSFDKKRGLTEVSKIPDRVVIALSSIRELDPVTHAETSSRISLLLLFKLFDFPSLFSSPRPALREEKSFFFPTKNRENQEKKEQDMKTYPIPTLVRYSIPINMARWLPLRDRKCLVLYRHVGVAQHRLP